MAEYYTVLKRAIVGLNPGSPEHRRAVYDKARNALISQLKAVEPPLTTSEISRQRLDLEEAIRRVEREMSGGMTAPRPGAPQPAPPRPLPRAPQTPPPPPRQAQEPPAAAQTLRYPADRVKDSELARRAAALRTSEAERAARPDRRRVPPPPPRAEPARRPDPPAAVPQPPAQARVVPHHGEQPGAYPDDHYSQRQEPVPGYAPQAREPRLAPEYDQEWRGPDGAQEPGDRTLPPAPGLEDGYAEGATGETEPQAAGAPQRARAAVWVAAAAAVAVIAFFAWTQRGAVGDLVAGLGGGSETAPPQAVEAPAPPAADAGGPAKNTDRLLGDDAPDRDVRVVDAPPAPAPAVVPATSGTAAVPPPASEPALTEQAALPLAPALPEPAPAAPPVGPTDPLKALLIEEPQDGSTGTVTAIDADVTWQFIENGPNGPEIEASLDVPERGMTVRFSLHENTDPSLPASHLVEVVVDTTDTFPGQGINAIPRVVLKPTEDERGEPLVGAAAKVADGFFWIALSSVQGDVETNLRLIRDQNWIDLPIVYETGQRAILTFEKGGIGSEVFQQALAAWNAG